MSPDSKLLRTNFVRLREPRYVLGREAGEVITPRRMRSLIVATAKMTIVAKKDSKSEEEGLPTMGPIFTTTYPVKFNVANVVILRISYIV